MHNPNDKIQIGVIGAGHLGKYHIECLGKIEGFQLTGLYDIDKDRSAQMSDKYHIASFDSMDTLIDQVDAVCIVTPTSTHFEIGKRVIEAGKHIFIEKPLTDDPKTSRELAEKISAKGIIGRVGHVERYNPAF